MHFDEINEVVRFKNVNVVRDSRPILREASFVISKGEHWALLGPNGAGKSTILSLCGAAMIPSSGNVDILGKTIGRVDIRQLRESIGHVNPAHRIQSTIDVTEVVLTGATGTPEMMMHWDPDASTLDRAQKLIDMMGLTDRAQARWQTLSQGERTRTLIARALLPEPKLLLLDEPCSGLDVAAREHFLAIIDQMHCEQNYLTTVMVTHHLEELPQSTTNVLLVKDGAVINHGSSQEMLTTENISQCFSYPIEIEYSFGRWYTHAQDWGDARGDG